MRLGLFDNILGALCETKNHMLTIATSTIDVYGILIMVWSTNVASANLNRKVFTSPWACTFSVVSCIDCCRWYDASCSIKCQCNDGQNEAHNIKSSYQNRCEIDFVGTYSSCHSTSYQDEIFHEM